MGPIKDNAPQRLLGYRRARLRSFAKASTGSALCPAISLMSSFTWRCGVVVEAAASSVFLSATIVPFAGATGVSCELDMRDYDYRVATDLYLWMLRARRIVDDQPDENSTPHPPRIERLA